MNYLKRFYKNSKFTIDLLNKRRLLGGLNFEQGKMIQGNLERWYYLLEIGIPMIMLKYAYFCEPTERID